MPFAIFSRLIVNINWSAIKDLERKPTKLAKLLNTFGVSSMYDTQNRNRFETVEKAVKYICEQYKLPENSLKEFPKELVLNNSLAQVSSNYTDRDICVYLYDTKYKEDVPGTCLTFENPSFKTYVEIASIKHRYSVEKVP